jgi:chromosomal replication initiator protein
MKRSLIIQTRICEGCGRPVMERREVTAADRVIEVVCQFYGVEKAALLGSDRTQHVAMVRHIAMYLARLYSGLSYPALGSAFQRDHSSIIHGVRMIERRIKDQPAFAEFLARLEHAIQDDNEAVAA